MDLFAKEESRLMRAERQRLEILLRNVAFGNFLKSQAIKNTIIIDVSKNKTETYDLGEPVYREFYDRACEMNGLFHEFIVDTYKELLGIEEKENAAKI